MKGIITLAMVVLAYFGIKKLIPGILAAKGNKAYAEGESEKAAEYYKKAAEIFGGNAKNKAMYALLMMRIGQFEEAEKLLNSVILFGGAKPAERNIAKAYRCMVRQKLGRLDEALEEAEELFEVYKSTLTYGLLGYLRQLSGGAHLEFCREAYDYNSDDRDICDNLAVAYIRSGDLSAAKEITDKLVGDFPAFTEGYYHSAIVALKQGDKTAALEYLDKINPEYRTAMTTVSEAEIENLREEIKNA